MLIVVTSWVHHDYSNMYPCLGVEENLLGRLNVSMLMLILKL